MLPIYQQALEGTLRSKPGGPSIGVSIENHTPILINIYLLGDQGERIGLGRLPGMNGSTTIVPDGRAIGNLREGQYLLVTATASGGFMGVIAIQPSRTAYSVDATMLSQPNDIGPVPSPWRWCLIPPDSPRVLVAFGNLSGTPQPGHKGRQNVPIGVTITREQYWKRQSDSYCLAPDETRTVSMTTTTGRESTSSEETTITASLGLSSTASWGAASATMSSSLSASSKTKQQVTVTEQSVAYVSARVENRYTQPAMFLRWQLVDVITVFDVNNRPIASVLTAESPNVVAGPYNVHTNYPLLALVNCGGVAAGAFGPDTHFSGGQVETTTQAINISDLSLTEPAPQAVYQSMRYGSGANGKAPANSITYSIRNLTPSASYKVTLHFAEIGSAQKAGDRVFNVSINSNRVLSNFDVIREAGAAFKALAKTWVVAASASGHLDVEFDPVTSVPIINGIIVEPTKIPPALPQPTEPIAGRRQADRNLVLTVSPNPLVISDDHKTATLTATLVSVGQNVEAVSQNTSIATVSPGEAPADPTGKASFTVSGHGNGSTTITVKSEGQIQDVQVTMKDS